MPVISELPAWPVSCVLLCPFFFAVYAQLPSTYSALCSLDAVFCLAVSHLLTCLLAESAITGALQLYTAMSSH